MKAAVTIRLTCEIEKEEDLDLVATVMAKAAKDAPEKKRKARLESVKAKARQVIDLEWEMPKDDFLSS